jgi:hypothetical protein
LAYWDTKLKKEFILEFEYLGRGLRELLHDRLSEFSQKDNNQFNQTVDSLIKETAG